MIEHTEEGHPCLSWLPKQDARLAQWGAAGFLAFWLCGWAAGECFAAGALFNMIFLGGMGGFQWVTVLFLTGWLGAWTIGGIAAMYSLCTLVRKPKPES